jgi:lactoylglutathione lyase
MGVKMVKFGYTILCVSDVQATVAFYEKPFGVEFEIKSNRTKSPAMEIALICEDVDIAFSKAIAAGAKAIALPKSKPWGQVVAYVADNNGFLVELCTPMAS